MAYENILVEKKEGIAYVTINRPAKLNALNTPTMKELRDAFLEIKRDDSVGVVILTGAGEKAFVAGADVNELAELDPVGGMEYAKRGQHILHIIENLGKPVIAALNGFTLGGGCELAQACHIRIAADTAKLGQPEVNLGIIPGYGGSQRLTRIVGRGKALELVLTGNNIDAQEAYRIGLVNQVVPAAELMAACEKMAKTMLSKGPVALKLAIEAIIHGSEMTLEEGLRLEADLFGLVGSSQDAKEGMKAFLEKRKAEFKGR